MPSGNLNRTLRYKDDGVKTLSGLEEVAIFWLGSMFLGLITTSIYVHWNVGRIFAH
jgi:hypothetical protein